MILSNEISFVVQGPVIDKDKVEDVISSIRKFYPESQVVLSTWEGADASNLDYDSVVYNEDPGAPYLYYKNKVVKNNLNRQLVSSLNGLREVTTKYAVKTRTDILFTSNGILRALNKYRISGGLFNIFQERVLVPANMTVNPKRMKMPHHISDFLFAGLTKDLIDLFDVPLIDEVESMWFENKGNGRSVAYPDLIPRYANEQYIWLQLLRKKGVRVEMEDAFDCKEDNVNQTENIIGDSLIMLNSTSIGFRSLKYPLRFYSSVCHVYTEFEWKLLYYKSTGKRFFLFDYDFELTLCRLKKNLKKMLKAFGKKNDN